MPTLQTEFLNFPSKPEIVATLSQVQEVTPRTLDLFGAIGTRLDSRTYDAAAFTFILMEVIHEYEVHWGENLGHFLPASVVALTGDQQLAKTALEAFEEIKRSIGE